MLGTLVAGCSDDDPEGLVLSEELFPFTTTEIVIGGDRWTVAVADTPSERAQGLKGVVDLGDLDGMLFVWDEPTTTGFTMRDTLMPIDIAFFDDAGTLVSRLEMVPCTDASCPAYQAEGRFRYAVETEAGGFDALDVLTLDVGS